MKRLLTALVVSYIGVTLFSCKDYLPSDVDSFNLDMNFTSQTYSPIVGRTVFYDNNFNAGESTLPLSFRISDVRTFEGAPAPELLKPFPVNIWKTAYTGNEQSVQEIEDKREVAMRPLWEIGQHSGTFTLYAEATSTILKTLPDSGYYFDVEVSSAGGRRYFQNLVLRPQKEEPFERGNTIYTNVIGDSTNNVIGAILWFNRKGDGNQISFKALDPDLNPISLSRFNTTNWKDMVHGFNMTFAPDSSVVTYDVAYPIPLVSSIPTRYTKDGYANALFSYSRIGRGGSLMNSSIEFSYKIYEPGDWEVVLYFPTEAPLFDHD